MQNAMAKEVFNVAYILAMAAQAGLNTSEYRVDEDSVDLTIHGRGFAGVIRNPAIDLQLKCSSQAFKRAGDKIKFPLKLKNYEDLRGNNVANPKYLVVLLVPESQDTWMKHHKKHASMHNKCYWVSIKDHPPTTNTTGILIDIPVAQRLDTHQLKQLMLAASNRTPA